MNKNKSGKNILLIALVIIVGAMGYWYYNQSKPSELNDFVSCLGAKGVKFYGAFWCSHCQAQKALFGNAKANLPYVECSTADSKGQTQICKDKGITSYPTWSFQETSTTTATTTEVFSQGEKTLQELADKTSCVLPASAK